MWPVFVLQVNFGFLSNDGGDLHVIVLFLHQLIMFLGAFESCRSHPLKQYFTLLMWPVFVLQFNFGFLSNDAEGVVHLIILFLH